MKTSQNILIEAAAGTGKTTTLIAAIIDLITQGAAAVRGIAALTFTEKAAGELKLRLRSELEGARLTASGETLPRIEQALLELEQARVSTIHTFCADLLRERPVEARIDPAFRVLSEPEANRLLRSSFDAWLQQAVGALPEGLRRLLRRIPRGRDKDPIESLRTAVLALASWRDFTAPWSRDAFDRDSEVSSLVATVHAYADMLRDCDNQPNENLFKDTSAALRVSDELRRREAIGDSDADYLEARLIDLLHAYGFARPRGRKKGKFGPNTKCEDVRHEHDMLLFQLRSFEARADADLAALLHQELQGAIEHYAEQKRRIGALDFVDLLLCLRDLLRENAEVRRHFQNEITHIFVDEFQDTDPIQVEILRLLSDDFSPGRLFLVGDPKQSIYRFRRADIGMYADVKQQLKNAGIRQMSTSFRAVPGIQSFVNAAFRPVMTEDAESQQAGYVPLEPHRAALDRPAVVALPIPRPYGYKGITNEKIEESLPDVVAAYVEWLLGGSGWGIKPQDICILFRRFESFGADVTRNYVQSLEARGIAQLLVGGKSFHGREEIETMRTALSAVEWPEDELSVYATLRGSLFGILDEQLFEYRHRYQRLKPFSIPADLPPHLAPIGGALRFIAELHAARNYRPVADTLRRLFTETRCHAGFVLRPSGKQVLANVMQLMEQARVYDESGALSFRGFVDQLVEEAEYGRANEAPVLEEGSEGVRLMTVHKAKGLEFPVVILADICCNETRATASRYVNAEEGLAAMEICGLRPVDVLRNEARELQRERAEAVRLAYVAATRARDLLVVPAVADAPYEGGWVSVFNSALYPTSRQKRVPREGFGEDATFRPYEFSANADNTVKPGDYRMDDYTVTWWDSRALNLDVPIALGIPQQELLGKDAPPGLIETDLLNYSVWRAERDAVIAEASRMTIRVETAIERSAGGEDVPEIEVVTAAVSEAHGPRYGTLMHAVLATVDLRASSDEIRRAAELQARILGAAPEEIESVTKVVQSLLAHPLIERASRAIRVRRELPLTLRDADGLVEGVVDLAFEEEGTWTVIDFKTDAEIEGRLDAYKRQTGLYAQAISQATGLPASGILMRV